MRSTALPSVARPSPPGHGKRVTTGCSSAPSGRSGLRHTCLCHTGCLRSRRAIPPGRQASATLER